LTQARTKNFKWYHMAQVRRQRNMDIYSMAI
jgi:hypothetical protein